MEDRHEHGHRREQETDSENRILDGVTLIHDAIGGDGKWWVVSGGIASTAANPVHRQLLHAAATMNQQNTC